jgi:hypothetical protein
MESELKWDIDEDWVLENEFDRTHWVFHVRWDVYLLHEKILLLQNLIRSIRRRLGCSPSVLPLQPLGYLAVEARFLSV